MLGVEKLTDAVGSEVERRIRHWTSDYEAVPGLGAPTQAALLMRRYMHEIIYPHTCRRLPHPGACQCGHQPNAMFRKAITPEIYQKAGIVSDPLNLFDIAPNADGAAALLLPARPAAAGAAGGAHCRLQLGVRYAGAARPA